MLLNWWINICLNYAWECILLQAEASGIVTLAAPGYVESDPYIATNACTAKWSARRCTSRRARVQVAAEAEMALLFLFCAVAGHRYRICTVRPQLSHQHKDSPVVLTLICIVGHEFESLKAKKGHFFPGLLRTA